MLHSNRNSVVILAVGIGLGALMGLLLFSFTLKEMREIEVQLQVSSTAGFNVDSDKIYFGSIPPTGHGQRQVILRNTHAQKALMRLRIHGEIAPWVKIDPAWVVLKPQDERPSTIHVFVPADAPAGNYSGTVEIITHGFGS